MTLSVCVVGTVTNFSARTTSARNKRGRSAVNGEGLKGREKGRKKDLFLVKKKKEKQA